jgi:hypothetical protein
MSAEPDTLSRRIDDLRVFEREYRGRLRMYFEDCLAELDKHDARTSPLMAAVLRVADAPDGDLREVLHDLGPRHRDRLLAALLRHPVEEVPL